MYNYAIRYNVYTGDKAPQEFQCIEQSLKHQDEQGLKKILETKHGAKVTLISWKESKGAGQSE